jgi:hypothetical protein
VIGAPTRPLIVHSARPAAESLAILGALLADDRPVPGGSTRVTLVDGAVDASQVSFKVVAVPRNPGVVRRDAPPLEFAGAIDDDEDGSVLRGSITAPTALALPAVALTVLVALFLAWNRMPLLLVALAVVAWIFLTVIVVSSLGEQRLAEADGIGPWLEAALSPPPAPAPTPAAPVGHGDATRPSP